MKLQIFQCKIKKTIMLGVVSLAWQVSNAGQNPYTLSTTTTSIDAPQGSTVYVAYSIHSNLPFSGPVKYTPLNSTIAEGTTCGSTFVSYATCTLILRSTASGAVGSTYRVGIGFCIGSCYSADVNYPVTVRVVAPTPPPPPPPPPPTPLPFIAAGTYIDINNNQWPLLALSTDNANTWNFPNSITQPNLTPDFRGLELSDTSVNSTVCTDQAALCVMAGHYTDSNKIMRPLLATSSDQGSTWTYSSSLSQPSISPAFFANGKLESIDCSQSSNLCVASGSYTDSNNTQLPLLTQSADKGNTWNYPEAIHTALPSLEFASQGIFHSTKCTDNGLCVAAGEYTDTHAIRRPLLAKSNDNGNTWNYSTTITQPTTTPAFAYGGVFNATNCSKDGKICAAVGRYVDPEGILRPLLAQSTDGGENWNYPTNVTQPDVPLFYIGMLNAIYCDGSTCIAVGSYVDTTANERPLLAMSHDAGNTWTYSTAISQPDIVPEFSDKGIFYGVNCSTEGVCIATGKYTDKNNIQRPLLALSQDQGSSWTYSAAVSQPTTTPAFANQGQLGAPQCRGTGSTAICMASGSYQDINGVVRPLLATTQDGGTSWHFSESVSQPSTTPAFANQGTLYNALIDQSVLNCYKTSNNKPACQIKGKK
jgi:hypothetical protein